MRNTDTHTHRINGEGGEWRAGEKYTQIINREGKEEGGRLVRNTHRE